jgi:hypothetical protein
VVDEGNILNWGGLWLLYNIIWYYTVLYGIIPRSPCRFQLYRTVEETFCPKHTKFFAIFQSSQSNPVIMSLVVVNLSAG